VVEEISFEAPDLPNKRVTVDGSYVRGRLEGILQKEDLSRYIL
jgi:ATP-dependent HslUV protease ATP-binding subunit HslU